MLCRPLLTGIALYGVVGLLWAAPAPTAPNHGASPSLSRGPARGAACASDPDDVILQPILLSVAYCQVTGGQDVTFTMTVQAASEDQLVSVSTDCPEVFVDLPTAVVVPARETSVSFTVTTCTVTASVAANVTGAFDLGSDTKTITVVP